MLRIVPSADFDALLARLDAAAAQLRSPGDWPSEQLEWLAAAGVLGWGIPRAWGGSEISIAELLAGYERLAAACLTTTFVLTQFNGACQRMASAEADDFDRQAWLPRLARGELFATVGISHLSTSRQHLRQPAVSIRRHAGDYIVSGEVPWVTGAPHADVIVTGGVDEAGGQLLLAVPCDAEGIAAAEPVELLALSASCTASVQLADVRVPLRQRLAGPAPAVMQRGSGGTGSTGTSALALGVAQRAIDRLQAEATERPDLREIVTPLQSEAEQLRRDLASSCAPDVEGAVPCSAAALRQRANSLVLRATQSLLAASKGAGFVQGHPAERAVREALFFLVWSCPQPVVTAALRQFACLAE